MSSENYYKGIKNIIQVSTNSPIEQCGDCGITIGPDTFTESTNHFIKQHGYKLLHVGTETTWDDKSKSLWHSTIAILGK